VAEVPKVDEFSFVLMAGVLFIFLLAFAWTTPTESPPLVIDSSFELTAAAGEKLSFEFTVSGKPQLTAVNLTALGEIRNWITFSKNNFDIRDSTTVKVTINVPDRTPKGVYSGRVMVEGRGGTDTFSIHLDVVGKERELTSRLIPGEEFSSDFTVSYYEGTDTLDSKTDVKVTKSYFSGRSLSLAGIMTSERQSIATGGEISLIIEETNSIGNLIVKLNDEEIYKRKVGVGEVVIPLGKDQIERTNIITIEAGPPGAMFWASSFYVIRLAEFNVDYKGAFAKEFNITLSKDEADGFRRFSLYYKVKDYTSPLPLMMIKVNNQIAYWDKPKLVLFDDKLEEDMFGNPLYLKEGTNTVTFMFEDNAEYTIEGALLTLEYYE